jgi:DNA-binding response OmpR family regulator
MRENNNSMAKITLIVEDDTSIGEVLVYAISQATPYTAMTVPDGFSALEVTKGIKPDLFILDYQLPRMTGIELYDRLQNTQDTKGIPTIIMSANLPEAAIKQRNLIGIKKPFELDELLDTIEKLIA